MFFFPQCFTTNLTCFRFPAQATCKFSRMLAGDFRDFQHPPARAAKDSERRGLYRFGSGRRRCEAPWSEGDGNIDMLGKCWENWWFYGIWFSWWVFMGNSWEGWGIKNVKNDDLNNQHGGTILYNGNVMGKSIAMGDKPIWQSCNQTLSSELQIPTIWCELQGTRALTHNQLSWLFRGRTR